VFSEQDENGITKGWVTGCWNRAKKSGEQPANSNAASDSAACSDTTIGKRRKGVHLGHTPADGLRRTGQRQQLTPEATRIRPGRPPLSTEIHPAYRLQNQPLTALARHSSF